jgi:hypothetical protein
MNESNFDQTTTTRLLEFLGMRKISKPATFKTGKVYRDYFTASERYAAKAYFQNVASDRTPMKIERYFNRDSEQIGSHRV